MMLAQRASSSFDHATPMLELATQFGVGNQVSHRIVASGPDSLAKVDGYPARLRKRAAVVQGDLPTRAEQLDLMAQRVGDRDRTTVPPELVCALRGVVVQDDEVANGFEAAAHETVVFIRQPGLDVAIRKELDQSADTDFDQMQTGRFERFEESAGEAHRDAVLQPRLA